MTIVTFTMLCQINENLMSNSLRIVKYLLILLSFDVLVMLPTSWWDDDPNIESDEESKAITKTSITEKIYAQFDSILVLVVLYMLTLEMLILLGKKVSILGSSQMFYAMHSFYWCCLYEPY